MTISDQFWQRFSEAKIAYSDLASPGFYAATFARKIFVSLFVVYFNCSVGMR